MRILGFSKKWSKLQNPEFTTFRFPRKDRDWMVGEQVQIVYKPRSREREKLGLAQIISVELRNIWQWLPLQGGDGLSLTEAIEDGFVDRADMIRQLGKIYHQRIYQEPMNKITLKML